LTLASDHWQRQLAEAFSSVEALCHYLQLDPSTISAISNVKSFPLKVPLYFAERIEKGNPDDPLLRQILPVRDELIDYPGYSLDPVGDLTAVAHPGVIQKYRGRVLLITTGACAIHCRYCFRRHFPYADLQLSKRKIAAAVQYISSLSDVNEVILSGGDPLLLGNDALADLIERLGCIRRIRRIRIHTRVPVVLPARIDAGLLEIFQKVSARIVIVLHANHPNELSPEVASASQKLKSLGLTLLNQSVLLAKVNDNGSTLIALSEQLFALGILPYYLHCLDKTRGVGHFEVSSDTAVQLMQVLREHLPGYLVPKLVQEQAGAAYKIPIG